VIVENPGFPPILYYNVTAGKAGMIVKSFLRDGDPLFEYLLGPLRKMISFPRSKISRDSARKEAGHREIRSHRPGDIDDYIAEGGYETLAASLGRNPEETLREIVESGLRGRGGAGFSTGTKWKLARDAEAGHKVVICNADEGDPGAYMDRTILESNPHQVLEGMASLRLCDRLL